jgi:hypothetical protein
VKTTLEAAQIAAEFRRAKANFRWPRKLKGVIQSLLERHFSGDPTLPDARRLVDVSFENAFPDSEVAALALSGEDHVYAQNIARLSKFATFFGYPLSLEIPLRAERDLDFLGSKDMEWSPFRLLNLLLMQAVPFTHRVAVVTSVRNEGLGILEWIAHHRALGIDGFFIYTNDNDDGSDTLLNALANSRVIRLIKNEVITAGSIQTKVLEHALLFLEELRSFEWVLFIDVDEFFIPRTPERSLPSVIDALERNPQGESASAACFHWKWFGSHNAFSRTSGFLLERFPFSIHNEHVKSLVRLRDVVSMRRVHVPILVEGCHAVASDFSHFDLTHVEASSVYGLGQINHYWNRSFEEFVLKRERGRISKAKQGDLLDYSTFFLWGANGRQGNYDPPLPAYVQNQKQAYQELMEIPGVPEALGEIEGQFVIRMKDIDQRVGLRSVYDRFLMGSG